MYIWWPGSFIFWKRSVRLEEMRMSLMDGEDKRMSSATSSRFLCSWSDCFPVGRQQCLGIYWWTRVVIPSDIKVQSVYISESTVFFLFLCAIQWRPKVAGQHAHSLEEKKLRMHNRVLEEKRTEFWSYICLMSSSCVLCCHDVNALYSYSTKRAILK